MNPHHPLARQARAGRARMVAGVLMAFLLMAFFRAQVLGSSDYVLQSESNRLRQLTEPAPRGIIRDRDGRVVADNVPGYAVSVLPAHPDSMESSLRRLQGPLALSDARLANLIEDAQDRPRRPLLVSIDADFEGVAAIEAQRAAFPRVLLQARPKRRYPMGAVGAHVVGYVGQINQEELDSEAFEGAEPGTIVGRGGLEEAYEPLLHGEAGTRYIEVDARGRIVGSFVGQGGTPPTPGLDLTLHLDGDLMDYIHEIFPEGMSGAVVALDVQTGGVLAMYSAPAYDPNVFVGVLDPDEWNALITDERSPLLNRALMGRYPPGSPWKLVSAAMALDAGVVTEDEIMPIACTGSIRYGNRSPRCWKPEGHGYLDMAGAIQHSCNVYFYQLGLRIGLERMLREGNRLGFGTQCGVDLPQEVSGAFPNDVSFWEERFNYRATEGEVLNLSIGQGPIAQTPLKMAQFLLAIARDGSAPAPSVYQGSPAGESWRLNVSEASLEAMREGMRRVTGPGGTAHMASLEYFDLMGKTGTAESGGDRPNHAWFTGMAGLPGGPPEVVVVVLVEYGDSGSGMAAPLMAKTADYYLRGVHGIPRDTVQTLREYLMTGRNTDWAWITR